MFIQNKCTNWYTKVVNSDIVQSRPKIRTSGMELHHVIPRSLGGTDDPSNLVSLTFREHFVCHRLLVRMTEGQSRYKMALALSQLTSKHRKTSSRNFEIARKELSKASKGIPKSDEWRKQMSLRNSGEGNPMHKSKGRRSPFCDLTPEKRTELGKKGAAAAWESKKSAGHTSPPNIHSEEAMMKLRETKRRQAAEGKLWVQSEEGRKACSERMLGKKRGPYKTQKTQKLWLLRDPDGNLLLIQNLGKAAKHYKFNEGNLITHGQTKGWRIEDRDFPEDKYTDMEVHSF